MVQDKVNKMFVKLFPGIILAGFILLVSSLVFSKGVCCGDDAYLALIAKNLATGLGYSSTVQPFVSRYTIVPYDPLVGTGPTIILPASLIIGIFGNTYWAPGMANLALWSFLLVMIGLSLRKYNHGWGLSLFTFSFLYLCYSLMIYHFEQWYALLGEVPSALLIIFGVIYFHQKDGKKHCIISGIIFSLAVQAKFLSLLAFLVFVAVYAITYLWYRREDLLTSAKKLVVVYTYLGIGFLLPFIVFESWKILSIGPAQFVENWRIYIKYLGSDGARVQTTSIINLMSERLDTLFQRFGILLPNLGFLLLLVWLMVTDDEKLKQLFFVFTSIFVVYSLWWVFFSIGWARYFIICLTIFIFLISLPLLSHRSNYLIFIYFLSVILLSSNNLNRFQYPFSGVDGNYFRPNAQTRALLDTSEFLSNNAITPDTRIATQWWATSADMEYLMGSYLNFTTFRDEALQTGDFFVVAVNTKFMSKEDSDFIALLEGCENVKENNIYLLANCSSDALMK